MATEKEAQDLAKITTMLTDLGGKLTSIKSSVSDIKDSIITKGVDVPKKTPLSDYDDRIAEISQSEEVDYTEVLKQLDELGDSLDTINGEVITATS